MCLSRCLCLSVLYGELLVTKRCCCVAVYGQPHVMSGDNLVHSVYLQMLSSWAVNLGIDNILYHVAHPLHLVSAEGCITYLFLLHLSLSLSLSL